MTYVLNLKPETAERIEAKARERGVEPQQWLENLAEEAAKPPKPSPVELEAAMHRVFDRYSETFEILAEGAK